FNFLNPANSRRRKEDIDRNFASIVEYSLKEEPDLFLMAGDIFDKKSPSNESRVFLIREVRKLSEAGINVVAIGGNHDMPRTPGATSMAFYAQDIPDGVDYLAMGHFHNSFERAHGRCRIVNPGSVERLDWSEFDDRKVFAWVDMNESGADVDFIPLEMRPMESSSLSLNRN